MTILQTLNRFYHDRQAYCSEYTLNTYRGHMKFFIDYLEESYEKKIDQLTFDDIPEDAALMTDFIIYLQQNHKCKNTSIRSYCRPVKAYLKYCYEEDYCIDFLKRVRMPKDDSKIQMPLFLEEVQRIDEVFGSKTCERDARNYCIFHLMLDCGLRSQEVRHLKVEEIDRNRKILTIVNSKGLKSRIVLIPENLLDEIYKYLNTRQSGTVFRDLKTGEELSPNVIKQLFQDLKNKSGVDKLHAHLCRHTFATSYLVGGGNLEFLRALMGHYDYNVTRNYTQMAAQIKMLGLEIYQLDPIFFTRGY